MTFIVRVLPQQPLSSTLDSHAVDAARPGAVVEVVEAEVGRVLPQPHLVAAPVRVLVADQVRRRVALPLAADGGGDAAPGVGRALD